MNFSDYEAVWKRQPLPRGMAADVADLRLTFEAKRRKMAAVLLVRDLLELMACGIMVAVYAAYWRNAGPDGWPMGLAILLILTMAGGFVRERLRSRRNRLGADAPLQAKIRADIAELNHQRRLVRRVWLWYLAPCAGAMLMHAAVIVRRTAPWDPLRTPVALGSIAVFIVGVCGCARIINLRAVRRRIEPRILELEKLHRELSSEG